MKQESVAACVLLVQTFIEASAAPLLEYLLQVSGYDAHCGRCNAYSCVLDVRNQSRFLILDCLKMKVHIKSTHTRLVPRDQNAHNSLTDQRQ